MAGGGTAARMAGGGTTVSGLWGGWVAVGGAGGSPQPPRAAPWPEGTRVVREAGGVGTSTSQGSANVWITKMAPGS